MVMDMFSTENSSLSPTTVSPRISFSHNLDSSLIQSYPYRSDSSSDFDFCITSDPIENEASSADELFCDGLIRHNYLGQKRLAVTNSNADELFRDGLLCHEKSLVVAASSKHVSSPSPSIDATTDRCPKERSKEIVSIQGCDQNLSKSFWRIKRSSSLHCESTKQKSSFWSSLPLLSRSNSTGSAMKDRHSKQNQSQRQSKNSSMAIYSQKPPLKRNYGGTYDYGIRISPVLNVTPPFISKTAANILGLGSFFGHGHDQKNKNQPW